MSKAQEHKRARRHARAQPYSASKRAMAAIRVERKQNARAVFDALAWIRANPNIKTAEDARRFQAVAQEGLQRQQAKPGGKEILRAAHALLYAAMQVEQEILEDLYRNDPQGRPSPLEKPPDIPGCPPVSASTPGAPTQPPTGADAPHMQEPETRTPTRTRASTTARDGRCSDATSCSSIHSAPAGT